ncbi:MAG TPA: BlaI/MecI/CopY family transcriptional regulator [Pseudonocardiaceae bacterium]|jgi:predicted transcriptional regulator
MNAEEGSGPVPDQFRRRRAGELSNLVLRTLRDAGEALTPAEVRRRLGDAGVGSLAYTTVVTILSRLREQGAVERSRLGRGYAYLAIGDSALAALRMRQVLDDQRDRDAVLARFVHELAADDERQLRELLDEIGSDDADGGHHR